jgi:hypothetical protein
MVILFFGKQSCEKEGVKGNRDGIGLWSGFEWKENEGEERS